MPRQLRKPLEIQEHRSIKTLRENIRELLGATGLSYKGWAKEAAVPESLGRNLNGYVLGDRRPRLDLLAEGADALNVELWQLFVPGIDRLSMTERKELNNFVRRYAADDPGFRNWARGSLEKWDAT